jgi:hypothetical protein
MTFQALCDAESFEDELTRWSVVAIAGLLALSVGYEAGSVLAGDSLDVLWLVPILGCATTFLALSAREDD